MVANACSIIAALFMRFVKWLWVVPWLASAIGVTYFAFAEWHFNKPEILSGVPIRVDIVFLGPLLLLSFLAAGWTLRDNIIVKKQQDKETQQSNSATTS